MRFQSLSTACLGDSLPQGTRSDLTDPPPSRTSIWSTRSPGRALPLNFNTDSITAHANHFFASETLSPPPIRRIDFALDAAGWGPTALDAVSTTLATFADVFSSSKLDYGECFLRPFEIKVPPGTQSIQSRPYRLNPVLSKQADAILDSYLATDLIQHSTSPWSSPLCASRRNWVASESPRFLRLRSSASTRCLTPLAAARFSPCSTFSRGLLN